MDKQDARAIARQCCEATRKIRYDYLWLHPTSIVNLAHAELNTMLLDCMDYAARLLMPNALLSHAGDFFRAYTVTHDLHGTNLAVNIGTVILSISPSRLIGRRGAVFGPTIMIIDESNTLTLHNTGIKPRPGGGEIIDILAFIAEQMKG